MFLNDPRFPGLKGARVLAETENLTAVHMHESASLLFKVAGKELCLGDFYGDPCCALIDPHEKWCLVGGEHLLLWQKNRFWKDTVTRVGGVHWIHDMRVAGENTAAILTDPWSDDAAVWQLSIETKSLVKVRDFDRYKGQEWVEEVIW